MKKIIFIILLINVSIIVYASVKLSDYEKGFNSALQCMMLLDLELKIKKEQKTWGQMAIICCQRNNVRVAWLANQVSEWGR